MSPFEMSNPVFSEMTFHANFIHRGQIQFSGKNEKNINLSSAELAHRVVMATQGFVWGGLGVVCMNQGDGGLCGMGAADCI